MLADGGGDTLIFAAAQGVLAPDDALQGGHFGDHLGGEVGFGEVGGAPDIAEIFGSGYAEHGSHVGAEFEHAVGFFEHRAEVGLEGERAEFRAEFFERFLDIFADEEIGIGKAGVDDVFVALGDDVEVFGVAVADADEVWQQAPSLSFTLSGTGGHLSPEGGENCKIALVLLHGFDEHITRQRQIFFGEFAKEGGRF